MDSGLPLILQQQIDALVAENTLLRLAVASMMPAQDQPELHHLRQLLLDLMSEVRPYCRPSMVDYDVFPAFKKAMDYMNSIH